VDAIQLLLKSDKNYGILPHGERYSLNVWRS